MIGLHNNIIMTMHAIVLRMNIAGGDECSRARCITTVWRRPVPPTNGHLSCTDTLPGLEGVRS